MASTTDPGAVPMGARPLPVNLSAESDSIQTERDVQRGGLMRRRGIRRCRKCNDNYKPNRAHHDSVTGRCVVKMDHYCPWVGNAVGIMNHKVGLLSFVYYFIVIYIINNFTSMHFYLQFFILFILYTLLTAIVSLTLIIIRVIRCEYYTPPGASNYNDQQHHEGCNSNHTTIVFILGIITILFFFFTFCMLLEQTEAISTNMSKIARMKTRSGMVSHPNEYAPVATEFNEVFGGHTPSLSWHWLIPLKVKFPEWALDNIMGYEWDVTFDNMPYQEPVDTDEDSCSTASGRSGMSSLGGRASEGNDRLGPEGLGQLGGMDVETGLDQELLNEEERSTPSKRSNGAKKRSSAVTS